MRLLNTHTYPPLIPEDGFKARHYAILSHTWGDDEVILSDLQDPNGSTAKSGWEKIHGAQQQAQKDEFDFVWIDTLCIDKSSSAELGEAINSMYRWYFEAEICYVYSDDVEGTATWPHENFSLDEILGDSLPWFAELQKSKWFKSGLNLQELIAPKVLRFYDRSWNLIGSLEDLAETVAAITGIHGSMLRREQTPGDFSVAQRMSWAAGRQTTRPEDRAYSLLGILDVTLDVRYGEGSRAFIRLQEEIIERSADQSILAWEKPVPHDEWVEGRYHSYFGDREEWHELLAPSPDEFVGARNIIPFDGSSQPYRMTNRGLNITCPSAPLQETFPTKRYFLEAMLSCRYESDPTTSICLNLCSNSRRFHQQVQEYHVEIRKRPPDGSVFSRLSLTDSDKAIRRSELQEIRIARSWKRKVYQSPPPRVWLQLEDKCGEGGFSLVRSEPQLNGSAHNLIWSLEGSAAKRDLVMYLRHAGGSTVELRLNLTTHTALSPSSSCEVSAYLSLASGGDLKPVTAHSATRINIPVTMSLPTKCSWQMSSALTAVAQLRGEHINGEYMYSVDLWAVKSSEHQFDGAGCLQRATN